MRFLKQYLYNLALAFDQLVNVILLGDPDDSISGRCGRSLATGNAYWWVKWLARHVDWMFLHLFNEKDHCASSIEPEENLGKELWKWYHVKGKT